MPKIYFESRSNSAPCYYFYIDSDSHDWWKTKLLRTIGSVPLVMSHHANKRYEERKIPLFIILDLMNGRWADQNQTDWKIIKVEYKYEIDALCRRIPDRFLLEYDGFEGTFGFTIAPKEQKIVTIFERYEE